MDLATEIDLDPERIERALHTIDPVFRDSPQYVDEQLCAALGRREVTVKPETANPVRSFKGRGAGNAIAGLPEGSHLVCASSGNFGQAVAYAGRARGMRVDVFTLDDPNPHKLARMEAFGARVTAAGPDSSTVRQRAKAFADEGQGRVFLEESRMAAIAEGAGTIGVELLRRGRFDTVVLPVGDGALISGVACWIKANAPETRIVGVNAEGAPAMFHSRRAGHPVALDRVETIADGINLREVSATAVGRVRALVDDIVLVPDTALTDAMALAADTLGILLEPAGAAGLAAIATCDIPGDRLATVLTGANPRPSEGR
ncbi:threonine ammonia-lyase [Streptomyces boninensis]|uniref:threonine ammonia-lyase n=1 Tax=Streptomyces boninensis TaxID=2039455 RepID=UPI003B227357